MYIFEPLFFIVVSIMLFLRSPPSPPNKKSRCRLSALHRNWTKVKQELHHTRTSEQDTNINLDLVKTLPQNDSRSFSFCMPLRTTKHFFRRQKDGWPDPHASLHRSNHHSNRSNRNEQTTTTRNFTFFSFNQSKYTTF